MCAERTLTNVIIRRMVTRRRLNLCGASCKARTHFYACQLGRRDGQKCDRRRGAKENGPQPRGEAEAAGSHIQDLASAKIVALSRRGAVQPFRAFGRGIAATLYGPAKSRPVSAARLFQVQYAGLLSFTFAYVEKVRSQVLSLRQHL
jgi:hypothetical protein